MNSSRAVVSVRSRSAVLSAAILSACAGLARAQPASWLDATTGFWNDSARWNPATVPNGPTADVTIDATGSLYDVHLDINRTIGSLVIDSADATFQLDGNTLSIVNGFNLNSGLIRGNNAGGLSVGGLARFSGVSNGRDVLSAGTLNFTGDVLFDLSDDVDICDTDVNYNGSNCTWQGNGELGGGMGSTYTFSGSTTLTILNDKRFRHNGIGAAPTIINNGTIRKTTGTGTTEFFNVPFTNTGTLEVASGTIKSNSVTTAGNTLTGGTWKVLNGSTLDLVGNTITTNAATIILQGAGSTFAAVDGLSINAAAGTFQLASGRNFTTAAGFTNNGTLSVGPGTQFTASQSFAQGSSTITGGGTVRINGAATFNGPTTAPIINGGVTVDTRGSLSISGATGLRLDTAGKLAHNGASGSWTGGDISMGDSAGISIAAGAVLEATNDKNVTWDNTGARPTFAVAGTFTKKTGTGTTFLSGVSLSNTGSVRVESGTLKADQPPVSAGTLAAGGKWFVKGASSLDFVATNVTTNSADVTLDGPAASFAALESSITTNSATGALTIANGKNLTTPGNFSNGGKLTASLSSTFEINPGFQFTNFNTGSKTLAGGEIILISKPGQPAVFRWIDPQFQIKKVAGRILLSGPESKIDNGLRVDESALNQLDTITETGSFEIADTREFRPEGSIEVQEAGPAHGKLVVGENSLFEIQDTFTLINFNAGTGEISNGDFNIDGTLSFPGAEIHRINNTVVLAGTGSIINKSTGVEAIGSLEYITARGDFTVRGGKDVSITPLPLVGPSSTLQVDGRLAVGPGAASNDSLVTINGSFQQNSGSVVEVFEGGVLDVRGVGPGTGNYTADTGSLVHLAGGAINVENTFTLDGTLSGNGTISGQTVINGSFSPGNSPGQVNFIGSLALTSVSALTIDITGYGAGIGFDKIDVTGPMTIAQGATLTLAALPADGFAFAIGQVFRVIDASSITGSFSPNDITGADLGGGLSLHLDWDDPTALRIVVIPAPPAALLAFPGLLALARRRRG